MFQMSGDGGGVVFGEKFELLEAHRHRPTGLLMLGCVFWMRNWNRRRHTATDAPGC